MSSLRNGIQLPSCTLEEIALLKIFLTNWDRLIRFLPAFAESENYTVCQYLCNTKFDDSFHSKLNYENITFTDWEN